MTGTADPALLLSRRAQGATSSTIRDILVHASAPGVISLAGGIPAPSSFPMAELRAAALAALEGGTDAVQYGRTDGDPACRAALAGWTDAQVEPEDLVVTTGSQQGLDLVSRVLVDDGDPVVVGDPDYLGSLQALRSHGAQLTAIPVDGDGLRTDVLAERLAAGLRPKLAYVVTNFHNPTGATLSTERRVHLAELAERYGFVVVEDDPYGELWFDAPPPGPVGPGSEHVVRLRSVSKTVAPGLRLGWMAGPRWLLDAVIVAKQSSDLHTSSLSQGVVTALAQDPAWRAAHLDRSRALYRERRDGLVDALHQTFGDAAPFTVPGGGMFVWTRFEGFDATARLLDAVAAGVAYVPGSAFGVDAPDHSAMRLSFATASVDELHEAVRRLHAVVTA
ncbi:PLP-dependent aminotransferase family protein [Aquihabitans sp. G128]|uniref:aminotransferase-like domain-containing protein n=1 Tax=Aquihabitans sp. G128 TaxID=2849779 RepID=UPI001C224468|nr:PLP-dependent aminotransferase family protein [Aquihabitans sp. G128]QXC61879.1 PLP-dependent aminotransferase family protein [Aquihabitans sp. G128]